MSRRRIPSPLPDEFSPDRATCEHCGQPISGDDICYTHDATGFADCGLIIGGGTPAGPGMTLDVELLLDPDVKTQAEPTTWYEDVQ